MSTPDSFSTPLQHHAVRRLKSGRVSHTPPSQASSRASSSQDVFSTPPRSSRTSSSTHSARHSALQTPAGSPRTPIQGTPSRRKGAVRIVRGPQKPWYERLAKLPVEIWDRYELQLNEFILTDLEKLEDLAYPAGIASLVLHLFLRVIVSASSAAISPRRSSDHSRPISKVGRYANTAEARLEELRLSTQGRIASWGGLKAVIYRSSSLLCWLLVIASFANAFWLFSSRRKYRLFMSENTLNSPNAKVVQLNTSVQTNAQDIEEDDEKPSKPSTLYKAYTFLKRWIQKSSSNRRPQDVQELSVWMPPTFSLRFFAIYSPPMALMIQFLDRGNFLTFFVAASLLSLQTYLIVHSFTQMMADRQTVNSEVMHEYNAKFVAPRVFYARKDASTMTNEAEMIDIHAYKRATASHNNSRRSSTTVGIHVPYY